MNVVLNPKTEDSYPVPKRIFLRFIFVKGSGVIAPPFV